MLNKLEKMPVPLLPATVGACTLANVYFGMGYTWIREITIIIATIIWFVYLIRFFTVTDTVKKEYLATVPSSLYAGFTMLMMIFGNYYFNHNEIIGKGFWFSGVILHSIHIVIFTYRNIFKGVNMDTFVPSYFVTYNGIMVSVVMGKVMNQPMLLKIITIYGIAIFLLLLPFMIYRLFKYEIKDMFYHTQAILLAPSSLCTVSYILAFENKNIYLLGLLYILVLGAFIFIIYKLPKFFSFNFMPTYAGMTFPMAIGIVATLRMSEVVGKLGYIELSSVLTQLSGIQLYLTTGIIFFYYIKMINWIRENVWK